MSTHYTNHLAIDPKVSKKKCLTSRNSSSSRRGRHTNNSHVNQAARLIREGGRNNRGETDNTYKEILTNQGLGKLRKEGGNQVQENNKSKSTGIGDQMHIAYSRTQTGDGEKNTLVFKKVTPVATQCVDLAHGLTSWLAIIIILLEEGNTIGFVVQVKNWSSLNMCFGSGLYFSDHK